MSYGADAYYELEQERKRELYLERIRENTRLYVEKYKKMYKEFKNQGYSEILIQEMKNLKEDLEYIENNIINNVESARNISQEVGRYIYTLRSRFNYAKKEKEKIAKLKEERIALQKEAQKNEKLKEIDKLIENFSNPIEKELSIPYILELKSRVESINIKKEFEKIKNIVTKKAQNINKEVIKAKLQDDIEMVKTAPKELLQEIEKLIKDDKLELVSQKIEKAEEAIMDERIRKETIKSLIQTLKKEGFKTAKPKLIDGDVVVKAQKPSGSEVFCKVSINGKFSYKFDNKQAGDACKKDMDKFDEDLSKFYGVKIKDKKVTWTHPRFKYKDAYKIEDEYKIEK